MRDPRRANGPKAEATSAARAACCTSSCRRWRTLEDYLELLAAVEATAAELGVKVVLEGYPPPRDPRLKMLAGHARPGRDRGQHPPGARLGRTGRPHRVPLRGGAPARACRPRSSCSTAATPAPAAATTSCSAAPRRPTARSCAGPTCWRSLLAYWHNHPSLSLPVLAACSSARPARRRASTRRATTSSTSSRSRFGELRAPAGGARPACRRGWSTALLRNLLIDVTGNTHRAEFCIDKLYSPDGATGRLGLLELRAFEMPPHARMSLAQQLLLRALVALVLARALRGRAR
ncbi:MAG: transglutaminase family protein [Comamonadaceae bacterium]|nr:transglutaminase family protein [Comamonadaceae bacterium]